MIKKLLYYSIFFLSMSASAQIGINTENPTAFLDVNGTVRVENLINPTGVVVSITGVTSANRLSRTSTGAGFIVNDNTLELAPVTRNIGELDLSGLGTNLSDISALLGVGENNETSTFIRVFGYTSTIDINGISGGFHGRRVTLYFSENQNVRLKENSTAAQAENRFVTLATSQITVSGTGFVELVYDANAGPDGLGRWLVLKFNP